MKKAIGLLFFGVLLSGTVSHTEEDVYPNRWVRVASRLADDNDVEKVLRIAGVAAEHGLNGMVFSAGLDQLDLKPPDYLQRLKRVHQFCSPKGLRIIPSILSAGYGGSVLAHDKNLAAGLPVRDALFVVGKGKAMLVEDPSVPVVNGGFEEPTGEGVKGFSIFGKLGEVASVDQSVFKHGRASLRFENFGKHPRDAYRISQTVSVHPYRCYRLKAWVKSEGLGESDPFGSGNFRLEVLGGQDQRRLQYENPRMRGDADWQQVAVAFNSWNYDRVEIVPSVQGARGGKFWLDDLEVEEIGLVNLLRRPGTPLIVRGEKSGTTYVEGQDYRTVRDPHLNFLWDHEGPAIELSAGSRIKEGERLRVSFYHGTKIYNDQTPVCMSEPKLFEIWRTQARLIHEHLAPAQYLLNMDELRTGGSCQACRKRGLSMAQILGDCVARQFKLIREVNPKAEVFIWSDMFDPRHNANPDRKYYYLAEGTFVDSWKYLPKEMGIVCWNYRIRSESLRHFSSLGFRTVAGAYYDADNLDNPKGWLEALDATPGASGILYTTWLDKYELLPAFGDLVSRRR
ncbi:MAG: hypothetical protein AB1898_18530 [Acidobacteriota bacterium]